MHNYRPKSTQLYPEITVNCKNFTWKEKDLDQLYIQTYRHFTHKMKEIKSFKPPIQPSDSTWFDFQYAHTEEPIHKNNQLKELFSRKKKKQPEKTFQIEKGQGGKIQWLSTKKIQQQEKKNFIKTLRKEKPATALIDRKSPSVLRKTFFAPKKVISESQVVAISPPILTTSRTFDTQTVVDLILAANKIRIIPYPTSSFLYFNVFVDDGNNSEMIKNSMRKRSGWRVVQAPNVANMIWSQFYKYSLDSRPQRKIRQVAKGKEKQQIDGTVLGQNIVKCEPFRMKSQSPSKKKEESNPLSFENYQKQIQKLCPKSEHERNKSFKSIQVGPNLYLYNHFPNHHCISDKKNLLKNLKQFYTMEDKNVFEDVPFSIQINEDDVLEDLKEKMEKIDSVWIIKPGENSNRGKGIVVCKNIASVFLQIQSRLPKKQKQGENVQEQAKKQNEKKANKTKKQSFLVQQYVQPLLYNKRKIDIRMFLLATCTKGKIRGYLYDEGYIRTSSKLFSLENFDRFIHLTNDAVQFESPDYGKYEEGNKLSWKKFQQWVNQNKFTEFWPHFCSEVKKISKNILECSREQLLKKNVKKKNYGHERKFSQCSQGGKSILEEENMYFQIFGLDFLIDKNFKVWLIEVNTNPSLNTESSRVVRNLIPKMIDNAFDIAVEPFARVNRSNDTTKYENHFEVIFDDEWRETKGLN